MAREITIGQFNPAIDATVGAHVRSNALLDMVVPTYVFATLFLGEQASVSLIALYAGNDQALNSTFTGTLGPIPFTRTINLEQDNWGVGDLIPQFAVDWNSGVNNYMAYLTGDIPIGLYSSTNLANIGLGQGRSTAAWATSTSIRRPGTNFQCSPDSPETQQIQTRTTPALIGILIGAPLSF